MIFDAMVPWEYRESWDFVHVLAGCWDVIDDGWHPFLRVLTNQSVKRWIHWSVPRVKQPHKIMNSTNHQSPSTWSQKCIDETCVRLPSDTQRNIFGFCCSSSDFMCFFGSQCHKLLQAEPKWSRWTLKTRCCQKLLLWCSRRWPPEPARKTSD